MTEQPDTKHMENILSTFLYQLDSRELMDAQKRAYIQGIKWPYPTAGIAFEAGWAACWQALCTIEETRQNAALNAELAKLHDEGTEI